MFKALKSFSINKKSFCITEAIFSGICIDDDATRFVEIKLDAFTAVPINNIFHLTFREANGMPICNFTPRQCSS